MKMRTVALAVLGALVAYPAAVATKGQLPATFEQDRRECREQAADEIESPLVALLSKGGLWALGGAALGAGVAAGVVAGGGSSDPKEVGVAIGGGAALGFVIGSIVGTFKGTNDVSRAVHGRQEVFSECMTGRGYRVDHLDIEAPASGGNSRHQIASDVRRTAGRARRRA